MNNINNTEMCYLKNSDDAYLKWLIGVLGPVVMGSKPAEIISFPNFNDQRKKRLSLINELFTKCRVVNFRIIPNETSAKILFYNPKSLDNYLQGYSNKKFLNELGYPDAYDLDVYIDFISKKLQIGEMPHEIGVFLGYPLKDIIGFIGHPSLRLTKINGWRVYGDPKLSDLRYEEFIGDREYVSELIEINGVDEVLYMM